MCIRQFHFFLSYCLTFCAYIPHIYKLWKESFSSGMLGKNPEMMPEQWYDCYGWSYHCCKPPTPHPKKNLPLAPCELSPEFFPWFGLVLLALLLQNNSLLKSQSWILSSSKSQKGHLIPSSCGRGLDATPKWCDQLLTSINRKTPSISVTLTRLLEEDDTSANCSLLTHFSCCANICHLGLYPCSHKSRLLSLMTMLAKSVSSTKSEVMMLTPSVPGLWASTQDMMAGRFLESQDKKDTLTHTQYHQHPEILQHVWATSRTKPGSQSVYSATINNDISSEVQN